MNLVEAQFTDWYREFFDTDGRDSYSKEAMIAFLMCKSAAYGAAQMQARCKAAVKALRVSGGGEWTEQHIIALKVLDDAVAAIDALDADLHEPTTVPQVSAEGEP